MHHKLLVLCDQTLGHVAGILLHYAALHSMQILVMASAKASYLSVHLIMF